MSAQLETWRVSTPEGVFETDLETLKQWIVEGCVQPNDKVSKGNLSWLDAGRVPMLRAAFAAERVPYDPAAAASSPTPEVSANKPAQAAAMPVRSVAIPSAASVCSQHPEAEGKYVCRDCGNGFCDQCPKFVGASKIPLCPLCGDLCSPIAQLRHKAARQTFQTSGFGFADFGRALGYPLQHKLALVFGAAFYGLLLLAGFRGRLVASVIMFGCISHVISQVAWGRMDRSFLPDFSEFSLWDDLAVPFGLGIGVTVVTWGPTIVLIVVLLFGLFSGSASSPSPLAQAPPDKNEAASDPNGLSPIFDPNADPKKLEEADKKLNQLRPGYQISQEAEKSKKQLNDPTGGLLLFTKYLAGGMVIVLLLLLSLGWAIFYYPMALAVAGYTQSFGSVINPLVGLDTIRRMGLTYFKAFGMVLVIQVVGFVVAVIVAVITAPLALPFFGNLPAMFIDGSVTFYFNLVIACVLGLSLYKCADRLGIEVD